MLSLLPQYIEFLAHYIELLTQYIDFQSQYIDFKNQYMDLQHLYCGTLIACPDVSKNENSQNLSSPYSFLQLLQKFQMAG